MITAKKTIGKNHYIDHAKHELEKHLLKFTELFIEFSKLYPEIKMKQGKGKETESPGVCFTEGIQLQPMETRVQSKVRYFVKGGGSTKKSSSNERKGQDLLSTKQGKKIAQVKEQHRKLQTKKSIWPHTRRIAEKNKSQQKKQSTEKLRVSQHKKNKKRKD